MSEYDRLAAVLRAAVGVPQVRLLVLAKVASRVAKLEEGERLYRHLEGLVQCGFAPALMPVPKPKEPPPVRRRKLRKLEDPVSLSSCTHFKPKEWFREGDESCGASFSIIKQGFWDYFAEFVEEQVPDAAAQRWSCGNVHMQRALLELGEPNPRNVTPAVLMHLWHVFLYLVLRYRDRPKGELLPTFYFFVRTRDLVVRIEADGWNDGWHLDACPLFPKQFIHGGSIVVPVKSVIAS